MKQFIFVLVLLVSSNFVWGQSRTYSAANAHSHNDYDQSRPLVEAMEHRFGSVEADLFLRNDSLMVAHYAREIKPGVTFESLYLEPLVALAKKNKGVIYSKSESLQLLIDLKTDAEPTLKRLVKALAPYQKYLYPKGNIYIVISGNLPAADMLNTYPSYIAFDGRPELQYTPEQLKKIGLISQNFTKYSKWKGVGELPEDDRHRLKEVIDSIHSKGKKVRFWASPDTPAAWDTLKKLGVDYINTDHISDLALFLTK